IESVRNTQLFIRALEGATLEGSGLDEDVIDRLRNPIQECVDISDDKDFRLSLDILLADTYASEETYESTRAGIQKHTPAIGMLSHHQIRKQVETLTGVVPITHDMCINSCITYTAHFDQLEACFKCSETRYDSVKLQSSRGETKVARRQFDTIPIGPVLQALWQSKEGATRM
ncbi:hypothetical protein DFH09DRAFT_846468, partial [Mycena vulgaris]